MLPNPSLQPPKKTSLWRAVLPPLVVLVVVAGAWIGLRRWKPTGQSMWGYVVIHQSKGTWQPVPAPSRQPQKLRVSHGGVVWAQPWDSDGLGRLEHGVWREYRAADLGMKAGEYITEFALDGEEVWAATTGGALHWDGHSWRRYPEAIASAKSWYDIAAGGGQAWVLDCLGNLSHFESGKWTVEKLVIPGVAWDKEGEVKWPGLARTVDGTLWLVRGGVWRFDSARWVAVPLTGKEPHKLWRMGVSEDHLWVWDHPRLLAIPSDSEAQVLFERAQMGLLEAERPEELASAGSRVWLATSNGVLAYDGSSWRRLQPLPEAVSAVNSVGADSEGELWAIGTKPSESARRQSLNYAIAIIVLGIAFLGAMGWFFHRLGRRQAEDHRRVRQAVEYATGEAPTELLRQEQLLERGSSWKGVASFAGLIAGTVVIYLVVRRVWPQAPAWTFIAIAFGVHVVMTFFGSLRRRTPKPSDPIGPGGPSRYDWRATARTLGGALVFLFFMNPHWLPRVFGNPLFWFIGLPLAAVLYQGLGQKMMLRAAERGDFDGAIRRVQLFHFYHQESGEALKMRGHMLLLGGRFREAEETLRKAIAGLKTGLEQAFALEYLGDALAEQRRYDDAMRSYQAAVNAVSWFVSPYRRMAEMLLRREESPEEAMSLLEKIDGVAKTAWRARQIRDKIRDDVWIIKAWALARLGRSSEVAPAIEKAFKATNQKSPLDLAATHYRAGMAMRAMGNESAAKDHFKKAVEYDPHGWRGGQAKAELAVGSVWGSVKM